MPYQYFRETFIAEEADRLVNACETPTEQLIVWTLLGTGQWLRRVRHDAGQR
jgi:hypothetical protein